MALSPHGLALACALAFSACAHTEAREPPVAPLPPMAAKEPQPAATPTATPVTSVPENAPNDQPAAQDEPISSFMADHFLIAISARDAVVAGDMGSLRAPLQALADYQYKTVAPSEWLPWMPQLQETARLTAHAATLEAAATGVATMGRLCGECHLATGGGPKTPKAKRETHSAKRDNVRKRMVRHMVAADQLWEGLTTPSDSAWNAGAAALKYAPATTHESLPPGFVARLSEVQELGVEAGEAATLEQRSNVYGLLLATCANCHAYRVEHDF